MNYFLYILHCKPYTHVYIDILYIMFVSFLLPQNEFGKKLPKRIDEEDEELKTFRLSEFIIFNLILHIVFNKYFLNKLHLS